MMPSATKVFINLTSDDVEEPSPLQPRMSQIAPARHVPVVAPRSKGSTNGFTNRTSFPYPQPYPQLHASASRRSWSTSQSDHKPAVKRSPEPPAKKRRVSILSAPPPANASPSKTHEAFNACYEKQVNPHISEAVKELFPNRDKGTRGKLRSTIFEQVVDDDVEQNCRRNGFKLSEDVEACVRRKVLDLAKQLKDRPDLWISPSAKSDISSNDSDDELARPSTDDSPRTKAPLHTDGFKRGNSRGTAPTIVPSIESDPADVSITGKYGEPEDVEHDVAGEEEWLLPNGDEEMGEYYNHQVNQDDQAELNEDVSLFQRGLADDPPPLFSVTPTAAPKTLKKTPLRVRRNRVKSIPWYTGKAQNDDKDGTSRNSWFRLSSRPYLSARERRETIGRNGATIHLHNAELRKTQVLHVDFDEKEIEYLQSIARLLYGETTKVTRSRFDDLRHLLKKARKRNCQGDILRAHAKHYKDFEQRPPGTLLTRSVSDLERWLNDVHARQAETRNQRAFTLARDGDDRVDPIPSLLFARETTGNRSFASTRRYVNFTTAFKCDREDHFEPKIEWTNCAGDISTISWVSKTQFICGTTTHSDSHNQQYNKPGNLLLGSSLGTLQAFPDHRIVRPIVSHGDNALDSMVESQDPWLFSSVVSSDYDPKHDLAFTSSFDGTVKIWKVRDDKTMDCVGTWKHTGRVNFVLASKHSSGKVATAADILTEAVRVYHIENGSRLQDAGFDSYSCTKIDDEDYVPSDKWGYCPAAIRWGLGSEVQHLLLVGYSPRSLSGQEGDIPENKLNTGALCVWDTINKTQVKVIGGWNKNVFEVGWHPYLDIFAAATAKADSLEIKLDDFTKTQIRIFSRNEDGQYLSKKTLDCAAMDINELSLRPNSSGYMYVAACCTDGNVYVWDTSGTDSPLCVLEHGDPVEELLGDREDEDIGVKFAAWASTGDRLYTGSSDGIVKVWNIRHGKGVLVRNLLEVMGPITYGAFSPDNTKLVVGDGTGRVYLLGLDEGEADKTKTLLPTGVVKLNFGGRQKAARCPRQFTAHPDIPPPETNGPKLTREKTGRELGREYIERRELTIRPIVGAVQGPYYANTGLFRADAHLDEDGSKPLLGAYDRLQQENRIRDARRVSKMREVEEYPGLEEVHKQNVYRESQSLDLDPEALDISTRLALEQIQAETIPDYDFSYEELPEI